MRKILLVSVIAFLILPGLFANGSSDTKVPEGTLASITVDTAPILDGQVDNLWADKPGLTINTVVPGYPYFDKVYKGDKYEVTVKSVHTNSEIFFLYQWTGDNEKSVERLPWYFNTTEGKWMQKPKKMADAYYPATYEDKIAIFWAIGDTFPDFKDDGCAVLCHDEEMSTPVEGEMLDTWHWKLDRTGPVNIVDDKWMTFSEENGRKADAGTSAYKENHQTIKDSAGNEVVVPIYWVPGKKDYNFILASDPGKRKIVALNSDNNLVDEDGTVLKKEDFTGDAAIRIPSVVEVKPATGSRGDVAAFSNYDEVTKTWTVEMGRKISTGHDDDVDFSDAEHTYYFSLAVFDAAAIAHATPGGMAGTAYPMIIK